MIGNILKECTKRKLTRLMEEKKKLKSTYLFLMGVCRICLNVESRNARSTPKVLLVSLWEYSCLIRELLLTHGRSCSHYNLLNFLLNSQIPKTIKFSRFQMKYKIQTRIECMDIYINTLEYTHNHIYILNEINEYKSYILENLRNFSHWMHELTKPKSEDFFFVIYWTEESTLNSFKIDEILLSIMHVNNFVDDKQTGNSSKNEKLEYIFRYITSWDSLCKEWIDEVAIFHFSSS